MLTFEGQQFRGTASIVGKFTALPFQVCTEAAACTDSFSELCCIDGDPDSKIDGRCQMQMSMP